MRPYYQDDYVTIYHGDCQEILSQLDPVDLILTDPPYGRDALPLWKILGQISMTGLIEGGWCLAYCGHSFMPEILNAMGTDGMIYRWMIALIHSGPHDLRPMAEMLIQIGWKPILVFRKPPFHSKMGTDRFRDTLNGAGRNKSNHPWEQAVGEAKSLISQFQGMIVDPFLGSGTTLRAAKDLGRKAIGIEIEEKYCEIAAKRMAQEVLDFRPTH